MDEVEEQKTKKVALYLRVSSEDQVEKFGLPMQLESLTNLINSKGRFEDGSPKYELAGERYIYQDGDVSGTVPLEERPQFARLLEDLTFSKKGSRPFDVIAVYKIDRLARKLKILLKATDIFKDYEIELISANESIDTSNAFGRAILGIVGVIAELEIETTKQRATDGRKQAWKVGVVMGQQAEYGYDKDPDKKRVILDEEAEIVKRIFRDFVFFGLSAEQIARNLTDEKIPSPSASAVIHKKRSGKKSKKKNSIFFWRDDVVRKILRDEVYLGLYYYGKTKKSKRVAKDKWQLSPHRHKPIIDKPTFSEAQEILRRRYHTFKSVQKRDDSHTYLLSGLLRCDTCKRLNESSEYELATWNGKKKEIVKGSGNYSYYYECGRKTKSKTEHTCSVLQVPAKELEEYVLNFARKLLRDPKSVFQYQKNLQSTRLHIKHLEKRLEKIREQYNAIPNVNKNLREQHKYGYIDTEELKNEMDKSERRAATYTQEINKLMAEKAQTELPMYYSETLEKFAQKYAKGLENVENNREQVNELLTYLISDVVVYSRPLKADDRVSGPKTTKERFMPSGIKIVMRLPHEILMHLIEDQEVKQEFGVNPVHL